MQHFWGQKKIVDRKKNPVFQKTQSQKSVAVFVFGDRVGERTHFSGSRATDERQIRML